MLLLLGCWILAGAAVAAVDMNRTHHQMKNSSVCLNVTTPPPHKGGSWMFGGKFIGDKDELNPWFASKVTFDPSSLTLCIKALKESDAGEYLLSYRDNNFTFFNERHRVVVQDAVPAPVLQVSVLRSNLSAGFCRIRVNCSVRDDWVTSVCGADSCEPSQRSIPLDTVVLVSISNWTVVCSGQNHVSAKNVSTNMSTACFSALAPGHAEAPPILTLVTVSVVCLFVFVLIAFTAGQKWRMRVEPQPRLQPRPSTSSSASQAAYENVDASRPPGASPGQEVDTVYSMAQVPCVTPPPLGSASPSPSVPVRGGGPTEVNTLYSVLQKPQHRQQVT